VPGAEDRPPWSRGKTRFALVYGTLAFAFVAEGISLIRAVRLDPTPR
jgi:hypothetical protein